MDVSLWFSLRYRSRIVKEMASKKRRNGLREKMLEYGRYDELG